MKLSSEIGPYGEGRPRITSLLTLLLLGNRSKFPLQWQKELEGGVGRRTLFPTCSNLPFWHSLRWLDDEEKAKRTWGSCCGRGWPSGPLLVPVVVATLLPSLGVRSPIPPVAGKVWRGHLPLHPGCPEFVAF